MSSASKAFVLFGVVLALSFACSHLVAQEVETEESRFGCVLLSDSKIANLREAVEEQQEPTYAAFQSLREFADQQIDRTPAVLTEWYVPGYYRDAEGHQRAKNGLADDANAAYAFAICYRMTGESKYAESAIRLINAWATGVESMSRKDDSMLSFSYHFPAMILAADLLRDEDVWPGAQQNQFEDFLQTKALPMNTMDRSNNWGNWGLVLATSCATYLHDETLFQECVERWKYFIDHQIADDGHLPHEVNRSGGQRGIWYSHFSLMPQTVAAEILRVNGVDLFEYESPEGRSLEDAFHRIAAWTEHPETFPYWSGEPDELRGVTYYSYFEILNTHWPDDSTARLLNPSRPMTATHSAPFLTFTHGDASTSTQ